MLRFLSCILAFILLLIGVIALLSPIPVGIVFIALGLSLLLCVSERAQRTLKTYRTKHPKLNQRVITIETKIIHRFTRLLQAFEKTRPDDHETPPGL